MRCWCVVSSALREAIFTSRLSTRDSVLVMASERVALGAEDLLPKRRFILAVGGSRCGRAADEVDRCRF